MRRTLLPGLAAALLASTLPAEVEWSGLSLSQDSRLLFAGKAYVPGAEAYTSLFSASVETGALEQLTFYPESVTLLDDRTVLQVQNRFGVYRMPLDTGGAQGLSNVPGFPAFARGGTVRPGSIMPLRASPDGRYIAYVRPTGPSRGSLVLLDVRSARESVVAESVELSYSKAPALWSADSKCFVYAKGGSLFYFAISQHQGGKVPAESFRLLGPGSLRQVSWSRNHELIYIQGVHVYRIYQSELFTRSIYAEILNIGAIIGKLPFSFDPNFDSFWLSPDGKKILFAKEGRSVFLYSLNPEDYDSSATGLKVPSLFLPRSADIQELIWSERDTVTIITRAFSGGTRMTGAFRLKIAAGEGQFSKADLPPARAIAASPDGNKVALLGSGKVEIYDYESWRFLESIGAPDCAHAIWRSNDELILAGSRSIERYSIATGSASLLALSQADDWGFGPSGEILVKAGSKSYMRAGSTWKETGSFAPLPAQTANPSYRVYLDVLDSGAYRNIVMVRSIKGLGTKSLFIPPDISYEAFPAQEEALQGDVFSHGSRLRRREVALTFDAVDEVDGLTDVLKVLNDYGIRATFFVGGEFLRRNPGAAKEIADSGHEVGSLFFADFDMTDQRFVIDEEFVKRGLARNEDDYYAATGKELSLLWHSPYYVVNSAILKAGKAMNYVYVGRDVDPLDWVSERDSYRSPGTYFGAHEIIERVLKQKKPGSIIPIRLGIGNRGRRDYLFHYLDILINNLILEGYSIVPVSTLIARTK